MRCEVGRLRLPLRYEQKQHYSAQSEATPKHNVRPQRAKPDLKALKTLV